MELVKYKCFGNATWTHKHISSRASASPNLNRASKVNKRGKKRVRKNWRVEISRTALLHLLQLPLQCWPPSAHQSCRSFPAISQSADRVQGQYFSTQCRMKMNKLAEITCWFMSSEIVKGIILFQP